MNDFITNGELRIEAERLCDENEKLQAENAKLRELVWDMWDFYCVVPDEPHVFKEELDFSVEVWKRMSELGWKWADD